jgi:hypothetical protein
LQKKTTENLLTAHVIESVLQGSAPSKAAASKKQLLVADPPVMAKRHADVKQEIALLVIVQNLTVQKEVVRRSHPAANVQGRIVLSKSLNPMGPPVESVLTSKKK